MADRVFCIDLGSSFTKVALRRGKWINADVVTDPRMSKLDELKMCVPTTVAVDYSTTPARPIFGDAALDRRQGPKLKVFTNWKKALFAEAARAAPPATESAPAPPPRVPSRLEALLGSTDFLQLAERRGVPAAEIAGLHKLFAAAAAVLAPATEPPSAPLSLADSNAFKVATLFFSCLRKTVLEVCRAKQLIENPETIPARLCVPAFAPEKDLPAHAGVRWLAQALTKAGWSLVEHRPIVSEPYSNAIGVLTRGGNSPRWQDMFGRGLLTTSVAEPRSYAAYLAVVIDVGAFTVDFAALSHDTGGKETLLDELEFHRREVSLPLGVFALDDAVLAVLPQQQAEYLGGRASADEWMDFRSRVYAERQPFFTTEAGEIGGGAEAKRIEGAIAGYADRLAKAATDFLSAAPDVPFKELILTGGGCAIPAIQDALIRGAEAGRDRFRKIHLPSVRVIGKSKKSTDQQKVELLDAKTTRGSSAIGGASAYFDMNREPYPMPK